MVFEIIYHNHRFFSVPNLAAEKSKYESLGNSGMSLLLPDPSMRFL